MKMLPVDAQVPLEVQVMFNLKPLTARFVTLFDARQGVSIPSYVAFYPVHPWPANLYVRAQFSRPKESEYVEGWHLIRASLQIEEHTLGMDRPGLVCLGMESAAPSCLIPFPSEVPEWPGMFTLALRRTGP